MTHRNNLNVVVCWQNQRTQQCITRQTAGRVNKQRHLQLSEELDRCHNVSYRLKKVQWDKLLSIMCYSKVANEFTFNVAGLITTYKG